MFDDMVDAGACCQCGAKIKLPKELYEAAHRSPDIWFYCAYGHRQHYPKTATEREADKLRRKAERAEQESARLREERDAAERRVSAAKGQITKLKKRAKAGMCPCCNRHFTNLERHMATKHADMDPAEPLKVIDGGLAR